MNIKICSALLLSLTALAGCGVLDRNSYQPPNYIFESWSKRGASIEQVKQAMRSCGYRDLSAANDLTKDEAARSEACMTQQGFALDTRSYRPDNCYGQNSPYLCNRLWGGEKPKLQPVKRN